MITIKDMAQILGISTTTVSNVIHGKTGEVSPATVEKVQKLIDEYGYVPNINARNLANNRSKMIGLAMKNDKGKYENFVKDPFGGELVGAVEKQVRKSGYYTMLYVSDDINEIINCVSSWNVDGLVLMGMTTSDLLMLKKKFKKPMVFVDSYFQAGITGYVNVGIQDREGTRTITDYIIKQGHKRIAFLADNCVGTDYERFMGYREALERAGILYCDEDFIMLYPGDGGDLSLSLSEVYRKNADYTAFVAASDWYAVQFINYLMDHGVRVPEDISVTGFDNNNYSKIIRPALTTVNQNVTYKGEVAVNSLVRMIDGEQIENSQIILPTNLVVRDSVKKIEG